MKPGNRSARSRRRIEKARQRERRRRAVGLGWLGVVMRQAKESGLLAELIQRDRDAEAEWKARAAP